MRPRATRRLPAVSLVSGTVKDLVVGCGIDFVDPAAFRLSGVPGDWHVWTVTA